VIVAAATRRAKHLRAFSQVIFSVMSSPFHENIVFLKIRKHDLTMPSHLDMRDVMAIRHQT